jgi:hypothetical protein
LLKPPTPHVSAPEHEPQSIVPPHPSALTPQSKPRTAQVVGVQLLAMPASFEETKPFDPSKTPIEASRSPGASVAELPHDAATREVAPESATIEMRRPT